VIDTAVSNFTKTEAGRVMVMGMQSLKLIGQPDDVASIVEFLASDASRWITGDSPRWLKTLSRQLRSKVN
jgi:3-oxoacyl-[acyl-carrier protein] reductase